MCLLYTPRGHGVWPPAETGAAHGPRQTAEDDDLKEFTRRRLARSAQRFDLSCRRALSWDIELGRADAGDVSSVSVSGEVKPLPVIGAFAQAMGGTAEGGYVELKVDVSYQSRPEWLEGDYDSWIAAWD